MHYQYLTQADITELRHTGSTAPIAFLEDAVRDYDTEYLASGKFLAS